MGLDLTYYEAAEDFRVGSYSWFMRLRDTLYRIVHGGDYRAALKAAPDNSSPIEGAFRHLLNHSDCDGSLEAWQCAELCEEWSVWRERVENDSDGQVFEQLDNLFGFLARASEGGMIGFH